MNVSPAATIAWKNGQMAGQSLSVASLINMEAKMPRWTAPCNRFIDHRVPAGAAPA